MSDVYKNPVNQPQDDELESRRGDIRDWGQTNIAGPGGRTTNIENNEKGILETTLSRVVGTYKQAALGSSHDSHAFGVYAERDDKFSD